jgi:autotransporter-associated beta strand protein
MSCVSILRSEFAFGIRVASLCAAVLALMSVRYAGETRAADVTWNNGSTNFLWDTSSANWSTGAWNNGTGDGAIFNATGVGALNLTGPINVNSLNFTVDGYSLTGVGPLNFVNGVSTQTTGVATVGTGATAKVFVPINSAVGFQKIGAGVLELNSPSSFTGVVPLDGRSTLSANLLVGGSFGTIDGGTLRVMNSGVIPATTNVSIGTGYLDIGSNNQTLANLIFTNQNPFAPWNPILNANNGVVGSGTLRVLGEINVQGVFGDDSSNSIATPFDLGGGTQIIRIGGGSQFVLNQALMFTNTVSNGSLLKTIGYNTNGVQASNDGMSLLANNTYTGSTVLNSGTNVATGTNATTLIKISGPAGPPGSVFSLQGANGSAQSATVLQAFSGGTFALDNNAAVGAGGAPAPNIPAAQNNNRIRDDAELQLRDGNFTYRGLSTAAASETLGALNVQGGHNIVTLAPTGAGGTATVTVAGPLSLASRATMLITTTTLGAASKMFVNGALPAADATGILPRIVGTNDFVTYSGVTGITPYTGYSPDFNTAGTNVAISASTNVASSVNINALKNSAGGNTTLTIGAGQTLGITSGMILNSGFGAATITGGTLAFGSNPGVLFSSGNILLNGPVTGSNGIINARGTNTISGDLTGLTGSLDVNSGTMNFNTNTFSGPINLRTGTLNLNVSQTGAGQGPITIGVAQNDSNIVATNPSLSLSGAGANAVFNRDIIVDNGATNAAGVALRYNQVPGLLPLSNSTGSQTINGNVTLNTPIRLQGGGGSGTGSTNFNGNITGPGIFHIPNGRAAFFGTVSNAGGFNIGDQGFTAKVAFQGTGAGNGPVTISGGNSNTLSYSAGALPGGAISVWNSSAGTQPSIIPLNNSTITNPIILGIGPNPGQEGNATVNVGSGITAEWAGPISGFSPLTKAGVGALVITLVNNAFTGPTTVNAGTLSVNGGLTNSSITVNSTGVLQGTGLTGPVTINSGGVLAPGNSIGTLGTANLGLLGGLTSEIDLNGGLVAAADLLNVTGSINLTNATLTLPLLNAPVGWFVNGSILLASHDGSDLVSGVFSTIAGLPAGYSASVDYAYTGVDSLGRTGDGNDIAITLTPEPSTALFVVIPAITILTRRRRAR